MRETYDAMLKACRDAKHQILLEQYIFEDFFHEAIGNEFLEMMLQKARSGVQVSLYVDALGSFTLYNNQQLQEKLKDAGVRVSFYKTMSQKILLNIGRLLLRNHRKMLCIDGEQVWCGGVVIGEAYTSWKDLMVCITDKEVVKQLCTHIDQISNRTGLSAFTFEPITINKETNTQLLGNSPGFTNRHVAQAIHDRIQEAQNTIRIVTPYFSPPLPTWLELIKAAKRGVRVNICIPLRTDNIFVNWVHMSYFQAFKKMNIQAYVNPNMNHGKLVMIDEWCTFGSTNFDVLSFIFNHELNLASEDEVLYRELQQYYDTTVRESETYSDRHIEKGIVGVAKIMFGYIARLIA